MLSIDDKSKKTSGDWEKCSPNKSDKFYFHDISRILAIVISTAINMGM